MLAASGAPCAGAGKGFALPGPHPPGATGPWTPRLARGAAGFTLAELVVVIAVIGIMLGLLVPRLGLVSTEGDLKAAVRTLSGLLAEGRNQAMMSGQATALSLDLGSGRCWLGGELNSKAGRSLPEDMRVARVSFRRTEPVETGVAEIPILAKGLVRPTLIVLRAGEQAWTLSVRPFDARLTAYEGAVDWNGLAEARPW